MKKTNLLAILLASTVLLTACDSKPAASVKETPKTEAGKAIDNKVNDIVNKVQSSNKEANDKLKNATEDTN